MKIAKKFLQDQSVLIRFQQYWKKMTPKHRANQLSINRNSVIATYSCVVIVDPV